MKIYDEASSRSEGKDNNTYHGLRVRLFKAEIGDTDRTWSLYLRAECHEVWEPEARYPTLNTRTRVYVGGPDSKRIRQAIAVIDKFQAAS